MQVARGDAKADRVANSRIDMSSIMRRRNRLMAWSVMGMLLS
jgi:hypothetical protein